MIKNLLLLFISILLVGDLLLTTTNSEVRNTSNTLPCTCDDNSNPSCDNTVKLNSPKSKYNFWTESNISLLNEEQKNTLNSLEAKIGKGEKLTLDEKKQMWELKDIVFKSKLGEENYIDFKNLMSKKKSSGKLTQEEIARLKSYFTQVKGE